MVICLSRKCLVFDFQVKEKDGVQNDGPASQRSVGRECLLRRGRGGKRGGGGLKLSCLDTKELVLHSPPVLLSCIANLGLLLLDSQLSFPLPGLPFPLQPQFLLPPPFFLLLPLTLHLQRP